MTIESRLGRTTVVADRTASAAYVGRAGQGEEGTFGNPIRVGRCPRCGTTHVTPRSTLPCFKEYFDERIAKDPIFRDRVLALRGRTLWCPGRCVALYTKGCHAEIIADWLNAQMLCAVCDAPSVRFVQDRTGSALLCATCELPVKFNLPPLKRAR